MLRRAALCASALTLLLTGVREAAAAESRERQITTDEIESWLDAEPGAKPVDTGADEGDEEPLPAPRRHGLTVESGVGFVNHLSELKHIMPLAPLFQVRVGYEVLPWLMPFVESDVAFASTAYASRPPPPRAFFHLAAGAGLRLSVALSDTFGLLGQGSLGIAFVSEQNVLSIYGYPNADEPNLYFGGELGFEWFPINPHLSLGVRGGLRTYGAGLTRETGGGAALALLGTGQIRYTF
ncbi:MAG TPA: hypothetical protein VFZ53_04785 [Polyangiaceae bacterium]